jgi:hypothetical protein
MVGGLRQLCGTLLTCRARHEQGSFGEAGRDFWPLTDDYGGSRFVARALPLQRWID